MDINEFGKNLKLYSYLINLHLRGWLINLGYPAVEVVDSSSFLPYPPEADRNDGVLLLGFVLKNFDRKMLIAARQNIRAIPTLPLTPYMFTIQKMFISFIKNKILEIERRLSPWYLIPSFSVSLFQVDFAV